MTIFNPGGDTITVTAVTNSSESEPLDGQGDVLRVSTLAAGSWVYVSVGAGSAVASLSSFAVPNGATAYLQIPFEADTVACFTASGGPFPVTIQRGTAR
jgi:hypothetical protein